MEKCRAVVLGGGGARGALQVGALRALFEAGFKPDLLVGTSIGAANAAFLALWGVNLAGVEALEQAYEEVANANLMDPRLSRIMLHARLALIGSDLNTGQTVIYGQDPSQSVLEGIMASIAIPPFFAPLAKDGQFIMDGGALSPLPVEPAMALGATDIIALDLDDPEGMLGVDNVQSQQLEKLVFSVNRRQADIEMALAAARNVPVHYLMLKSSPPTPIWDFSKHRELFQAGYETASRAIPGWLQTKQPEPG
jgi:NTE family protein